MGTLCGTCVVSYCLQNKREILLLFKRFLVIAWVEFVRSKLVLTVDMNNRKLCYNKQALQNSIAIVFLSGRREKRSIAPYASVRVVWLSAQSRNRKFVQLALFCVASDSSCFDYGLMHQRITDHLFHKMITV